MASSIDPPCELCEGVGEVNLLGNGSAPCPACVGEELRAELAVARARIAELEACSPSEPSVPVAWMTPDGRVVPAKNMEAALRTGGATLSAMRDYSIALYAAPSGGRITGETPAKHVTNHAGDCIPSCAACRALTTPGS